MFVRRIAKLVAACILCVAPTFAATLPCAAPCSTGLQSGTFACNSGCATTTRYWEAYIPAGITTSSSFTAIVELNGALVAPYNAPKQDVFVSGSNQGQPFITFANANKTPIVWIWSTCENETVSFAICVSGSGQWVWYLPGFASSFGYDPNDLGWINNVITSIMPGWTTGTIKTMLTGVSTGGIEAHLYASTYPSTISALATFAGPLCVIEGSLPCTAPTMSAGVPTFVEDGDADTTLPFCGGSTSQPWVGISNASTPSVDSTFVAWATENGCSGTGNAMCTGTGGSLTGVVKRTGTGCAKKTMALDYPNMPHAGVLTYEILADAWNFFFPAVPAVQSVLSPN